MSYFFKFKSIIIKNDIGFTGLCLDVDIATEGETIEETKNNLREAVLLYIESAIENSLPILRPVPEKENPVNTQNENIVETFYLKVNFKLEAYA